jgi:hypothetical protein
MVVLLLTTLDDHLAWVIASLKGAMTHSTFSARGALKTLRAANHTSFVLGNVSNTSHPGANYSPSVDPDRLS